MTTGTVRTLSDAVQLTVTEERNDPRAALTAEGLTQEVVTPMCSKSIPTTTTHSTESTRVVHVRDQVPGAIYIGRAMPRQGLKGSPFANPYKITKKTDRRHVIWSYNYHLLRQPELMGTINDLRGQPLACWCRHDGEERGPDSVCHGDVIAAVLEHYDPEQLAAINVPRWEDYAWPEWVPEVVRNQIQEFWLEDWHRGPKEWIRSSYLQGAPHFGEPVTLRKLSSDEFVEGRFIHCWNNIGRVVHEDGHWDYVSFDQLQAPERFFQEAVQP